MFSGEIDTALKVATFLVLFNNISYVYRFDTIVNGILHGNFVYKCSIDERDVIIRELSRYPELKSLPVIHQESLPTKDLKSAAASLAYSRSSLRRRSIPRPIPITMPRITPVAESITDHVVPCNNNNNVVPEQCYCSADHIVPGY